MTYLRFNKTSKKKLQLYGKAYARYGCAIVSPTKVIDQYLLRLHNGANGVEAEYSEEYVSYYSLRLIISHELEETTTFMRNGTLCFFAVRR